MCKVTIRGKSFKSSEHAYQCAKADNKKDFDYIYEATTPGKARRRGRKVKTRSDWDRVRVDIMREIVLAKFQQNEDLAIKLISTNRQELIEGNNWNDTFWGICNGVGENWMGKILMEVRQILMDRPNGQKKIPYLRTL